MIAVGLQQQCQRRPIIGKGLKITMCGNDEEKMDSAEEIAAVVGSHRTDVFCRTEFDRIEYDEVTRR